MIASNCIQAGRTGPHRYYMQPSTEHLTVGKNRRLPLETKGTVCSCTIYRGLASPKRPRFSCTPRTCESRPTT